MSYTPEPDLSQITALALAEIEAAKKPVGLLKGPAKGGVWALEGETNTINGLPALAAVPIHHVADPEALAGGIKPIQAQRLLELGTEAAAV
jgi:hypothetical protein